MSGGTSEQRIAAAEVFSLSHTIDPPSGVSIRYATAHAYVLLRLVDGAGRVGWGETYQMPGNAEAIRDLARDLIGEDPSAMRRHELQLSIPRTTPEARSAVLVALDDLRGQQLGQPIHRLYGGPTRGDVVAYAASQGYVEGVEPEETWPAEVEKAVADGFQAVKLRIGRYPIDRERELLAEVRAATPDHVRLMVDGNGAYTPASAVRMGRALESLEFTWFEEPLPQAAYRGYPALAETLDIALAGGEVLRDSEAALRLLAAGGVDIIQPEPVICGGVPGALRIAEIAGLHGVPVVPHTSGSAIGIAAALQVLACLHDPSTSPAADAPLLEFGTDDNPWRTDLLTTPLVVADGRVTIPEGPGLGVEVDEQFVRSASTSTYQCP